MKIPYDVYDFGMAGSTMRLQMFCSSNFKYPRLYWQMNSL